MGYEISKWELLQKDIIEQININDAKLIETNVYGDVYRIYGELRGPNSKSKSIVTIWINKKSSKEITLVTLFPYKEEKDEI